VEILEKYKFDRDNEKFDSNQYDMLFNCDLLIIDDLGTELANSFTNSEIFNVINTRLISNKKTIISTNLSLAELSQVYTDRISSRLFGNFTILKFFGPDLRWENRSK
jgi:DNA replication protein DnaC